MFEVFMEVSGISAPQNQSPQGGVSGVSQLVSTAKKTSILAKVCFALLTVVSTIVKQATIGVARGAAATVPFLVAGVIPGLVVAPIFVGGGGALGGLYGLIKGVKDAWNATFNPEKYIKDYIIEKYPRESKKQQEGRITDLRREVNMEQFRRKDVGLLQGSFPTLDWASLKLAVLNLPA